MVFVASAEKNRDSRISLINHLSEYIGSLIFFNFESFSIQQVGSGKSYHVTQITKKH